MVMLMLCHTWPLVIKISGRKTGCGALCLNCPFYMADLTGVFILCPALGTAGAVIPKTGVAVAPGLRMAHPPAHWSRCRPAAAVLESWPETGSGFGQGSDSGQSRLVVRNL